MWKPDAVGSVIGERTLTLVFDSSERDVIVRFGQPVREPEPDEAAPWWCPVEFAGLGPGGVAGKHFFTIAGNDSLQAIELAIEFAQDVLPAFAAKAGGTISW